MIPLLKPYSFPEQLAHIADLMQSNSYSTNHYSTLVLELLAAKFGHNNFFLTASCTQALEAILLAIPEISGKEVILPSWNYVAAANAVINAGAVPIWVDINIETGNINLEDVILAITPRTKVILFINYLGTRQNLQSLKEIKDHSDIFIIEDDAYGLILKNRNDTSLIDATCYSVDHTKPLHAVRGGIIELHNTKIAAELRNVLDSGTNRFLMETGIVNKYTWVSRGSKYSMTELNACLLLSSLTNILNIQKRMEILKETYRKLMLYPIIGEAGIAIACRNAIERNKLIFNLKKRNITASTHYEPLHLSTYAKQMSSSIRLLPYTITFSNIILRLPYFYELKEQEVAYITEEVNKYVF